MKRIQIFQYAAAAVASFGLVLPPAAMAADANRAPAQASAAETPSILDVSLGEAGTLVGQVVNAQAAPLPQTAVTVRHSGTDVAGAVTDAQGSFAIQGLQGGVFEVSAAGSVEVFRLWTAGTSPPSAHQGVLIVAGEDVNRGQYYGGPYYRRRYYRSRFTNGQILFGTALILGVTGAVVGASVNNNHVQQSGS